MAKTQKGGESKVEQAAAKMVKATQLLMQAEKLMLDAGAPSQGLHDLVGVSMRVTQEVREVGSPVPGPALRVEE